MGNIIFSDDFITSATITAISTASGYDADNVLNLVNLERNWRMNSANKSDTEAVLIFDMAAAKSLTAIVLDHVNFDKVVIKGHDSDLSEESTSGQNEWGNSDFTSGEIAISKDAKTNRYKVFIPLPGFNYRYLAILIPTTASSVGSYTSKWQIGRVGLIDSYYTFGRNDDWGRQRGASQAFYEVRFGSGRIVRASAGIKRWEATLNFNSPRRISSEEIDLDTLNNYNMEDTILFYENDGDTSKVYFCVRDTDYFGTYTLYDGVSGNSIKLIELI